MFSINKMQQAARGCKWLQVVASGRQVIGLSRFLSAPAQEPRLYRDIYIKYRINVGMYRMIYGWIDGWMDGWMDSAIQFGCFWLQPNLIAAFISGWHSIYGWLDGSRLQHKTTLFNHQSIINQSSIIIKQSINHINQSLSITSININIYINIYIYIYIYPPIRRVSTKRKSFLGHR